MAHGHGGSWAGATMAPEGKDNVKGQACLGCKRNSLLPLTHFPGEGGGGDETNVCIARWHHLFEGHASVTIVVRGVDARFRVVDGDDPARLQEGYPALIGGPGAL